MSSPDLTAAERNSVQEVLNTPHLSMGPKIEAFEESIRTFTGSKYAVGVNSGTAGLHLCVRAADIQPGDYVVTTPFSFVSSTNVILLSMPFPSSWMLTGRRATSTRNWLPGQSATFPKAGAPKKPGCPAGMACQKEN